MTRDGRNTLIESLAHQEGVRSRDPATTRAVAGSGTGDSPKGDTDEGAAAQTAGRSIVADTAHAPQNIYEICAYDGTPVALHVRIQSPGQKKRFVWQQPDGSSGLADRSVSELPLYGTEQLPDLKSGRLVVVTEGEKAADALRVRDIPAVGTVTGAAGCPSDDVLATLDSFDVAVWPDADPQGHKHAAKLLDGLLRTREGKAEGLFEVDLAALGLTAKGADADDWCPEDPIDELFVALKPYAPPPVLEPAAPTTTTQRIVIKGGKTRAGLLAALGHLAIDLRYDERSARVQFLDATADFPKWTNSDDMYRAELRERIADKFLYVTKDGQAPLAFSKDRFSDVIDALLNSRRIDPFKEWLDALPEWDGEKRLDFWLTRCFQIGDISPGLLRWASFSVLMGAVARTYTPGEKHDEMVILVGPQSLGKSTVWAWLLPPADRRSWFSDALKFHSDLKAQVEALQGRVLVEAAEMSGSTRAEVESIKGFLARQDDGAVRLTYRRDPIDLPRRCIIVGSTNDPRCLPNDPSGNRRFVPVPVTAGDPRKIRSFVNEYREQLWAEARYRITRAQRAGVAARRAQVTTGGSDGTLPGDRRDRRGCRAGIPGRPLGQRHDPAGGRGDQVGQRWPERPPYHDRSEAARLHPRSGAGRWCGTAVLDPARQESDRRPRPRRGHMTHKRETDRDREHRVVRAVIKVNKTHQDLLFDIAQAAANARHIEAAEVWEAMLQVHNDNLKRDQQIIAGILQTSGRVGSTTVN